MIKNNKGFMLIEVIIASTVVITTLVALYAGFNRLYSNYRIKNSYYNLDAIYATKETINSLIKNNQNSNTNNINEIINTTFSEYNYVNFITTTNCQEIIEHSNCKTLKKLYNIENMIFSKYEVNSLNTIKATNLNQTFNDYIDYLITYYDINKTTKDYNYIVLTEIKDGDNYYYANLRMR